MPASSIQSFRIEVSCDVVGSQGSLTDAIKHAALQELHEHVSKVRLANVRVERSKSHTHVCHVQLLGHGLDHVGGRSEHADLRSAVCTAAHRAVRALDAQEKFDPWTSEPPSSHRPH